MRLATLSLTAFVAGCASSPTVGGGSYSLAPGVASYDALEAATDKCRADGGVVKLKDGYDQHEMASYQCKIGGGR